MSYELTQQQAIITAGLRYRIPLDSPMFRPYIGAGARAYLMKTKIDGKAAAEAFGANEETVTKYGPFGSAGGELYIGPGALLLEIQVGWAKIDGFVLRDTNAGAVNSLIGYRLFI
jgi:outer membrane protein W